MILDAGVGFDGKLAELRRMYEPFVAALAEHLLMPLPAWRSGGSRENWRTTAWGNVAATFGDGLDLDPHKDD